MPVIYYRQLDGKYYISGTASPSDWVANLNANPNLVLNLKGDYSANVSATARHVTNVAEGRRILGRLLGNGLERDGDTSTPELDQIVATGLLIEITVADSVEPTART